MKAKLKEHSSKKQKRLPGGGRRQVLNDAFEAELLAWISTLR